MCGVPPSPRADTKCQTRVRGRADAPFRRLVEMILRLTVGEVSSKISSRNFTTKGGRGGGD